MLDEYRYGVRGRCLPPHNAGASLKVAPRHARRRPVQLSSPAQCGGLIEGIRPVKHAIDMPGLPPHNAGASLKVWGPTAAAPGSAESSPAQCGGLIEGTFCLL